MAKIEAQVPCPCGKPSTVALNGQWVCVKCFRAGLHGIRQTIEQVIRAVKEPRP